MLKGTDGIYIIGDSLKFDSSKYPNDRYDKELYIPKGYNYHLQKNMLDFMRIWQKGL